MSKDTTVSCSPFGCAGVIVVCAFFWAIIFGVTIGGKHYGADCSCKDGVSVKGD